LAQKRVADGQLFKKNPVTNLAASTGILDKLAEAVAEKLAAMNSTAAAATAVPGSAPTPTASPQHRAAFIPTPFHERILNALKGRALTFAALMKRLGVDSKALWDRGIKPLRAAGLVDNERRVGGYFRHDAPPPKFAKFLEHLPISESTAPDIESESPADQA
jgi:hypothetical protein